MKVKKNNVFVLYIDENLMNKHMDLELLKILYFICYSRLDPKKRYHHISLTEIDIKIIS